jgi:N-acyl-D-aspartate/D-glutamate deacylase
MKQGMLIRNGVVLDGGGRPGFRADLLLRGGKIEAIGSLPDAQSLPEIDAHGLALAPGFIDAHTHADYILAHENSVEYMEPFVRQGITTMITGNCGGSPAPANQRVREFFSAYKPIMLPKQGLSWSWASMGDFLGVVTRQGIPLNMGQLVGHGAVRMHVMGCRPGPPSAEELSAMRSLVRESLEAGALGLSYGLAYIPGLWADTDELIEVGRDLAAHDGVITVHLRNHAHFLQRAVAEMLRVAETLQVPLQISHFAPFGVAYAEQYLKSLEQVNEARDRGMRIGYDLLSPPVSSTTANQLFPAWLFEQGMPGFLSQLADPRVRARVKEDFRRQPEWPSWENRTWAENTLAFVDEEGRPNWLSMRLSGFQEAQNRRFEFQTVRDIAQQLERDPYDALMDLVVEEKGRLYFLGFSSDSIDLDDLELACTQLYAMPDYSFMTDSVGIGWGARTPTIYSTFPRFIGRHVRQWKTFTLEEAVRKATSLPAAQYGLPDRGRIETGCRADLVLFDPERILDGASFEQPYRYPDGIEAVIINGVPVWHEGRFDAQASAGQVLTRACA